MLQTSPILASHELNWLAGDGVGVLKDLKVHVFGVNLLNGLTGAVAYTYSLSLAGFRLVEYSLQPPP